MTEEKQKVKPVFRITTQQEDGTNKFIAAAYPHKKGKGHTFYIKGIRYTAFPVESKNETEEGA